MQETKEGVTAARAAIAGLALAALAGAGGVAHAAVIEVSAVGEHGWESTDTRVGGTNATTPAEIASRIAFVEEDGTGALRLSAPAGDDKATLAFVDSGGLGGLDDFTATYRWRKDGPVGAPAPALKLGLRTNEYDGSGSSRIGEENWDKVLIYEPYDNPDAGATPIDTWVEQAITETSGTWWMFSRYGATGTGVINPPHSSLTIAEWLADGTWGSLLGGASIVDVQLGVGSGNPDTVGYVDYLETNRLNGGDRIDFVAASEVPEPATLAMLLAGVVGLRARRRR